MKGRHITMHNLRTTAVFVVLFLFLCTFCTNAQQQNMVRIAKIKIDSLQVHQYYAALKEQMQAAVAKEPGVLTYYALADKKDETSITILEVYADSTAYQTHIQTPHFKKYKETVKDMVKSLELTDVELIATAMKPAE